MLRFSGCVVLLWALLPFANVQRAEAQQPLDNTDEFTVLMPESASVPGRERPEGLLCILGDDRVRLSGYPTNLIPSPDGKRLFAGTSTNVVDILDAHSMQILESFQAADSRVLELAVAPDGARLAAVSLDGKVSVWDVSLTPARKLTESDLFEGDGKKEVWVSLSTSRDRARFCVASDSGLTVFQWSPTGLSSVYQGESELSNRSAIISPRGDRLIVRPKSSSELQLWDLKIDPPQIMHRLTVNLQFPAVMCFQDDETLLAAAYHFGEGQSRLVSIAGDKIEIKAALENVVASPFRHPQFLDDGRLLIAATRTSGDAVFLCSGTQWKVIQTFPPDGGKGPMLLGASLDNQRLYVSTDQVPSALVREGDRFVQSTSPSQRASSMGRIDNLVFLRDGTLVFSTQGSVHAISLAEPTQPRRLPPIRLKSPLKGTCYLIPHPTNAEFALIDTSTGNLIQIRKGLTGFEEIRRFSYGNGPDNWKSFPWSAGYTPDGTTLAVGFWDRTIRLYSNDVNGLLLRLSFPEATGGHVCVLAFAPDAQSLACGDFSGNARIFAYEGALERRTDLPRFGDAVRCAQFSPDGGQLVLGSQNGEIRLTNLASQPHESRLLLTPQEAAPQAHDSNGGVSSMSWVAGGKLLLTAKGRNGQTQVVLWQMPAGEALQTWTFTGWMKAAIDPDGFMVAAARADGTVCVMKVSDEVQHWLNEAP